MPLWNQWCSLTLYVQPQIMFSTLSISVHLASGGSRLTLTTYYSQQCSYDFCDTRVGTHLHFIVSSLQWALSVIIMDGRTHLFHNLPLTSQFIHVYCITLLGDRGTMVSTTCPRSLHSMPPENELAMWNCAAWMLVYEVNPINGKSAWNNRPIVNNYCHLL